MRIATLFAAIVASLVLVLSAPARAGDAHLEPNCPALDPSVCAEICQQTLADGCPAVTCAPAPDCNVVCPDMNPRRFCPTADQIIDRFVQRRINSVYVICKVRKDGTVKGCKKHKMIDALSAVSR